MQRFCKTNHIFLVAFRNPFMVALAALVKKGRIGQLSKETILKHFFWYIRNFKIKKLKTKSSRTDSADFIGSKMKCSIW